MLQYTLVSIYVRDFGTSPSLLNVFVLVQFDNTEIIESRRQGRMCSKLTTKTKKASNEDLHVS